MMASSLPDSEALGKGLPSVTLYKNSVGKVVFAKCFSLGKGWNEKNTKNIEFFYLREGPTSQCLLDSRAWPMSQYFLRKNCQPR